MVCCMHSQKKMALRQTEYGIGKKNLIHGRRCGQISRCDYGWPKRNMIPMKLQWSNLPR